MGVPIEFEGMTLDQARAAMTEEMRAEAARRIEEAGRRAMEANRAQAEASALARAGAYSCQIKEVAARASQMWLHLHDPEAGCPGYYIVGPVGVGKTTLARELTCEEVRNGASARITTATNALSEMRMAIDADRESPYAVAELLQGLGFLALDDLGKDPPTDWALSMLFQVVDGRLSRGRKLVVTSQLERDEYAAYLMGRGGEQQALAIASRLATLELVRMDGPDRRLEARQRKEVRL